MPKEKEKIQKVFIPRGTVSMDKDCILEIPWKFKFQPYVVARKPDGPINSDRAHLTRENFGKACCGSENPESCVYPKSLKSASNQKLPDGEPIRPTILKKTNTAPPIIDSLVDLAPSKPEIFDKLVDKEVSTPILKTDNWEPRTKIGGHLICKEKRKNKDNCRFNLECFDFCPPTRNCWQPPNCNRCQSHSNDLLCELLDLVYNTPCPKKSEPTLNMCVHLDRRLEKFLLPLIERDASLEHDCCDSCSEEVLSNSCTNLKHVDSKPSRNSLFKPFPVRDSASCSNVSDTEDQEIAEVESALREFQKARRKLIAMMQECSSAHSMPILKKSASKKL